MHQETTCAIAGARELRMNRLQFVSAVLMVLSGLPAVAAQLQVHCQGEGPPVYLVGGGPAFTTWHLAPVQARLAERYRVCRWDPRGVGENANLSFEADGRVLSQWLADMAKVLPREPVVLWGHSWGALQVMMFAERHPERVRRLVLSNPVDPALKSLEEIERKRFQHRDLDGELQLEDIGTPTEELHNLRSKIASYFADEGQGWAYASKFTPEDTNGRLNVEVWEDYRQATLTDAEVRALAPKIGGLIYCREDVLQPEALAEYRRLLPQQSHVVLSGCGHFPWEERPEAYFEALLEMVGEAWQ